LGAIPHPPNDDKTINANQCAKKGECLAMKAHDWFLPYCLEQQYRHNAIDQERRLDLSSDNRKYQSENNQR
jgi:hypothetical protein